MRAEHAAEQRAAAEAFLDGQLAELAALNENAPAAWAAIETAFRAFVAAYTEASGSFVADRQRLQVETLDRLAAFGDLTERFNREMEATVPDAIPATVARRARPAPPRLRHRRIDNPDRHLPGRPGLAARRGVHP